MSVLPNQVLETVGVHGDFPIESITTSHDNRLLASSSHDHVVKFYDVERFGEMVVEAPTKKSKKAAKSQPKSDGFFADL